MDISALTKDPIFLVGVGFVVGAIVGWAAKPRRSGKKQQRRPRPVDGPLPDGPVEIYVGNLSYETTDDQLRKAFEKYGKVDSARIITGRMDKSKGYGFVVMSNHDEIAKAIKALDNAEMQGRRIRVNVAKR